jgi:capsular exopolysaccharide synthesis family protein
MSEIFDFLKKTEDRRTKGSPESLEIPTVAESKEPVLTESYREIQSAEPGGVDIGSFHTDGFDLLEASPQVKSVLDPLTLVGEQFRQLRSKLNLMQKQRGIKTILVTSSVPDEGKTFTASGLAGVFAQEPGKRVVLIDADMRKPKSGWNLGLNGSSPDAGLSDVLRGSQDFQSGLLQLLNPSFFFMPAGPLPSNPSELLSSQNLERVLKIAAANFDLIIVDSPPMLALSDTSLIAPLCDTVVLVVRANSTPSKLVLETVEHIGRERICGIVLNRQKQLNKSRYYYQYYYRSSKRQ